MRGITLFKQEGSEYLTTVIAERGRFETYPSGDRLALIMENGEIHRSNSTHDRYIRSAFKQFKQLIKVDFRLDTTNQAQKNDRTMTSDEMRAEINHSFRIIEQFKLKMASIPDSTIQREAEMMRYRQLIEDERRSIDAYLVEINRKIPYRWRRSFLS